MSNFYISHAEMEPFVRITRGKLEALTDHISSCRERIRMLIREQGFTGSFADHAKEYFGEIHIRMLECSEQIANELTDRIQQYLEGYKGIESKEGFILNSDCMQEFAESADGYCSQMEEYDNSIRELLSQIQDFVKLPVPKVSQIVSETDRIVNEVREYVNLVSDYEDHARESVQDMEQIVQMFESCIDQIQSSELSDFSAGESNMAFHIHGLQTLRDKLAWNYLTGLSFTAQMIERMKGLGYIESDIRDLYESCRDETDREFLLLLAEGNYEQMFQTDPFFLSERMDLVLADYLYRVFISHDQQEFQKCCNIMLAQTDPYLTLDWTASSGEQYRDIYLQRIYAGTSLMLDMNSWSIFSGNISEENKQKNWELLQLVSFWGVQYQILQDIRLKMDSSMPCYISFTENDPILQNTSFHFMYFESTFPHDRVSRLLKVKTEILETTDDLTSARYLVEREELTREAQQLWQKILTDSMEGIFSGILAIIAPELSVGYGLLKSLATNPDGLDDQLWKATGKDLKTEGKIGKTVLKEAINGIQSYLFKKEELSKAIAKKDQSFLEHLWGSAALSKYGRKTYLIAGLYNPDYLEKIGIWNREGIAGLQQGLDMQKIEEAVASYNLWETDLIYQMIYGFHAGNILEYPAYEIANAKIKLEEIIRMSDDSFRNWNLEDVF